MGSLPNPPEQNDAKSEELLGPQKALEEFFEISRNVPEQPYPGQALKQLLEKIDWGKVLEVLTCPEDPPCIDLLADPKGVLSDEKRWPKHLCPVLFQQSSTMEWASSRVTQTTPELRQWPFEWPLPIGKMALKPEIFSWELHDLLPFEGHEKALWAIRIRGAADSTLDLFGLGTPSWQGELRRDVRGHDPSLLDLARYAERWWGSASR